MSEKTTTKVLCVSVDGERTVCEGTVPRIGSTRPYRDGATLEGAAIPGGYRVIVCPFRGQCTPECAAVETTAEREVVCLAIGQGVSMGIVAKSDEPRGGRQV